MVSRSHVAGKRGVGPREIVVVGSSWAVSSPAVVEAAEDVKTLAVDIEVEDHHNEEVHQAEQQHSLADPLQGPAQHQPAHGQSHSARSATRIRSTSPLLSTGPSCTAVYQYHLWIQIKWEESHITISLLGEMNKGNSKNVLRIDALWSYSGLLCLDVLYCQKQLLFKQTLIILILCQSSFSILC